MRSDYDKWFVSKDASQTAIKCKRDNFMDFLKVTFGPTKAAQMYSQFRRATFSEHCKLELALLEE